ncbi:MAG: site-specific integrase [Sulfurimonas sp.]|uniref:tyrosine-type recombinase/integrase n=1 Tax=Sulfurimonas sp. TaxID=2022749 RepID=UPI0025CC09D1|nr:site-specific integrase [Sulfurimonas sp.]MCK9492428.1 site-specific integrase [Sulfurimonas sp.]
MTFEYYAKTYLKIKKTELKPSSYYKYETTVINKIMPSFLNREISTIKASELRLWLLNFDKTNKTLSHYISVLRGIFQEAIYNEDIAQNPCKYLRKFKIIKNEILPFSVNEVNQILNYVKNPNFKYYLYIAFYTGMRGGEIIGLKKDDINFKKNIIKVKRSRGRHGESSPKTQSGVRSVPILDILKPHLKDLYNLHDNDYLFITQFKKPYNHNETFYNKFWLPIFDDLDIKYRRLYNTRHTFATMMLSNGFTTPQNLAQILGHSNAQMVYQVYAKYINDGKFDFKFNINLY